VFSKACPAILELLLQPQNTQKRSKFFYCFTAFHFFSYHSRRFLSGICRLFYYKFPLNRFEVMTTAAKTILQDIFGFAQTLFLIGI
jgi:hypothetical protein